MLSGILDDTEKDWCALFHKTKEKFRSLSLFQAGMHTKKIIGDSIRLWEYSYT